MADERALDCDAVADDLELHVLGALDPADDARVSAHLADCPGCRHRVDELGGVLGEVLGAVPAVAPPDGFVELVAASARPPAATPPASTSAPEPAPAGLTDLGTARARRSRAAVRGAAAAAIVLLVAGGLLAAGSWWASSRHETGDVASPTTAVEGPRRAPLVTADGAAIGSVSLTAADGGVDLTMVVDRAPAGVPYDCVVRTVDGTVVSVGSWTTTEAGPASWDVRLDPGIALVDEVSLVVPGTGTVATAHPA